MPKWKPTRRDAESMGGGYSESSTTDEEKKSAMQEAYERAQERQRQYEPETDSAEPASRSPAHRPGRYQRPLYENPQQQQRIERWLKHRRQWGQPLLKQAIDKGGLVHG